MESITKIYLGGFLVAVLISVLLTVRYIKSTKNQDNYSPRGTQEHRKYETRENFNPPVVADANILYTDSNGNLGSTSDIGINYLTVSKGTKLSGSCTINGGTITDTLNATTSISSPTINATTSISSPTINATTSISSPTINATTTLNAGSVQQGGNVLVPTGVITMWNGSSNSVPAGWGLCNGGNGTPNLSGRFIVGVGSNGTNSYNFGDIGGTDSVKLTIAEMPSHSHSYSATVRGNEDGSNRWTLANSGTSDTNSAGGDQPHENRPTYFALCYIMKL